MGDREMQAERVVVELIQTVDKFDAQIQAERDTSVLGLDLPDGLMFDEWVDIGRRLCVGQQAIQWKIGDWWAFGDHRYGERAKVAAEGIFGLSFGSLVNLATVARRFETPRRHGHLPFTAFQEVASLPDEAADTLLDRAARENLSTRDLRREVQAIKAANDPGESTPLDVGDERPRAHSETEREVVEMASLLIEVAGRFKAGATYSEWDEVALLRATNILADATSDRKPVPDNFEVVLREHGRPGCELHYGVGRRTINRWIGLSGLEKTVMARRRYVDYLRSCERVPVVAVRVKDVPGGPEPLDRRIAALAGKYLGRLPKPWIVYPHPTVGDTWVCGTGRRTTVEVIALAVNKGFDVEEARAELAANLQAMAEDGDN